MSDVYKVEIEHHGCGACGLGKIYTVIGPDDIGIPESWIGEEAEEDAQARARQLNTAYDLGRRVGQQTPKLFTEEPPQGDMRVLAWDDDQKIWTNLWWYPGKPVNEEFLKLHYTHWIPEPPPLMAPKSVDATPQAESPAIEPAVVAPVDWGDDIPF